MSDNRDARIDAIMRRYEAGITNGRRIWLATVEAAAEQRGMRLAQEAIAGDQTVERARHRVGDILSTAQVLHVIDQAIKNRADQLGAQDA